MSSPLEIEMYQLADDSTLQENRSDGTGWNWGWATWKRPWMETSPSRFAYRCLPLTIANQLGLWVRNPATFTAIWSGRSEPGSVEFRFPTAGDVWSKWINDQFGMGIITWNTPILFRTRPAGSRLLVMGPANVFKHNAHPLTALIETDWLTASFTMNYKIEAPGVPVQFGMSEPLFQAIPLARDVCADLEGAVVRVGKLSDNPEIAELYHQWSAARNDFHRRKVTGEVPPDAWQKEYFQGRDALGRSAESHTTRIQPPQILRGAPGGSQPGE
ncbi:MAG TPA: DUF6065 family protein [Pirellulales bacterium]